MRGPFYGELCINALVALVCSPKHAGNERSLSPATLYRLAKRLGHILSLPLTLHHTLSHSLRQVAPGDPESHLYDNVPPELALVATAIVVLKLVYGLDGKMR